MRTSEIELDKFMKSIHYEHSYRKTLVHNTLRLQHRLQGQSCWGYEQAKLVEIL